MTKTSEQFKKAYQQVAAPEGLRREVLMEIAALPAKRESIWFAPRVALPVGALVLLLAVFIGLNTEQDTATSLVVLDNEVKVFEESFPKTSDAETFAFATTATEDTQEDKALETNTLLRTTGIVPESLPPVEEPIAEIAMVEEEDFLPEDEVGDYFDEEFGSARYDLILSDF